MSFAIQIDLEVIPEQTAEQVETARDQNREREDSPIAVTLSDVDHAPLCAGVTELGPPLAERTLQLLLQAGRSVHLVLSKPYAVFRRSRCRCR